MSQAFLQRKKINQLLQTQTIYITYLRLYFKSFFTHFYNLSLQIFWRGNYHDMFFSKCTELFFFFFLKEYKETNTMFSL